VARHRRPVSAPTPAELLLFSAEEWAAPGDEASWEAFRRWQDARRVYSRAHPDSALGSVLDQLRFERWMRQVS
jgi:hypothetical protein